MGAQKKRDIGFIFTRFVNFFGTYDRKSDAKMRI